MTVNVSQRDSRRSWGADKNSEWFYRSENRGDVWPTPVVKVAVVRWYGSSSSRVDAYSLCQTQPVGVSTWDRDTTERAPGHKEPGRGRQDVLAKTWMKL